MTTEAEDKGTQSAPVDPGVETAFEQRGEILTQLIFEEQSQSFFAHLFGNKYDPGLEKVQKWMLAISIGEYQARVHKAWREKLTGDIK